MFDIDTYRSKFIGNNARQHLFYCNVQFPGIQNTLMSGLTSGLSVANGLSNLTTTVENGLVNAGTTTISNIGLSNNTEDFKFFVRSTTLPESSVEETSTYFGGNQYKLPSVRRFQDWAVTFIIDGDASIVKKFWYWQSLIQNPLTGVYGKPVDFMTNQTVQLLGLDGSLISTYTIYNAWPKTIGQVQLEYSSNEFATVDITFAYQYHTVTTSGESTISSTGKKILQNLI